MLTVHAALTEDAGWYGDEGELQVSDVAPVLGVLAAVVGIADTIPYVRDTLRGSTRPHRATWLIWGTLADRRLLLPAARTALPGA